MQENKDRFLRLLQQNKALGISDQIDFDKFDLDSIIYNSVSLVNDDYGTVINPSELDNLTIAPSLANYTQTMMYWYIGERFNREVLRNRRAEYGRQIVALVATQLQGEYSEVPGDCQGPFRELD